MTVNNADNTFPPFTPNSVVVMNRRYLIKDDNNNPVEIPDDMFMRVATDLAEADRLYGADDDEIQETITKLYGVMRRQEFMPNSPTLMNAGRELQQLAACFVLPIEDSIDSIYTRIRDTAIIHQSGGGTGFAFSRLRPAGDKVKSTGGIASGPCSFILAYDIATDVVKQGGTRRGANMGVLSVYHPDVMEFISIKSDGTTLSNFNISIAVDKTFMEKALKRQDYQLINPRTQEATHSINAGAVFDKIIENAWLTGDPGLLFIDRMNADNPNPQLGEIESTNPCVTGDTLVYGHGGLKPIAQMLSENQIHLIATDGRFETGNFNITSAVMSSGIKPVYRLRTNEGYEVRVTADHKIMTTEGWKPADQLRRGDSIHIANTGGGFGEAGDQATGTTLGWLVGDGTFHGQEEKIASLMFYGEKHELTPAFASMVNEIVPAGAGHRSTYTISPTTVADRDLECVNSETIARIAEQHGITPTNKHQVPHSVMQGTREMQAGFLRGLFSADSAVIDKTDEGVSMMLSSSHLGMLKDVQKVLLNLGVASRIYENRKPASTKAMPNGQGGLSEFRTKANHELGISKQNLFTFNEQVGLLLSPKQERLQRALGSYRNDPYAERFVAQFESLDYEGEEQVYDLTEPMSHAFIANGIVVSNCGEQSLLPWESCNLGSINLVRMIKTNPDGSKELDVDKLRTTTRTAVHLLDNVIDRNNYPLEPIREVTLKTRRIGVGVMGWADFLFITGVRYDSDQGVELARSTMRQIREAVYEASQELAQRRGPFPEWENSIYREGPPMRNSAPTTIAPTGTISIIAGASSGIEPIFALAFVRNVMDNTKMLEVNQVFTQHLHDLDLYSEDLMHRIAEAGGHIPDDIDLPPDIVNVYRTSHQIDPEWHVRMQAAFQSETDNAVSKTINLPNHATEQEVRNAYELAYQIGCKGITVYRDGSKRDQVLSTTATVQSQDPLNPVPSRWRRPRQVNGTTRRISTYHGGAYVTINKDEDTQDIVEVFAAVGKPGGCHDTVIHVLTRVISVALQYGVPVDDIIQQLRGSNCCAVFDEEQLVLSPADAIGIALERSLQHENGHQPHNTPGYPQLLSAQIAPDETGRVVLQLPFGTVRCESCNGFAILEEGCYTCYNCGHTRC